MPAANVDRAIKNAMGKDQKDFKEVTYEGYGPHGCHFCGDHYRQYHSYGGQCARVFNKFSGNLGTQGSLSFLFDHKCVFTFKKKEGQDMDDLILELIDLGVDDEFDEDEEAGRSHYL